MNGNYPPGVSDADFMFPDPPEWMQDFDSIIEGFNRPPEPESAREAIVILGCLVDDLVDEYEDFKERYGKER